MQKIGFVYKLCINDGSLDDCYVGSTKNVKQRRQQHKTICNSKNPYVPHVYHFIRKNGGFINWDLYVLEEFKYDSLCELKKRERHYFDILKSSLNTNKPTIIIQDYYDRLNK